MENKDTKADYQEVIMAGDQKWEMVESTIGIILVCLFVCLFEIHIHYFLDMQGIFKSHLKKNHPTQKANSHQKSQFDLSSYYISLLKNGSIPLDRSMYIFKCNKTVEAIILKFL